MDEYKISLGIDLNDSQLKDVKRQLTNLTDNTHRIRIDIDNSRLLKQIKQAKSELKGLNDISGNNKPLNINTGSLEGSLNRVANALDDIKKTLGTFDDKSDMKSLLSSINQITASLGKATDESQNLVNALSALGKKDFGFNFNLKSGNSSPIKAMTDYGREARNKTIPALQEQATYLQELLGGTVKADSALEKYLVKLYKFNGISVKNNLLDEIVNTNSMSKQMDALERYVGYLKKVASTKGIDLSGFDAKFSKTADELVDDTLKIQTGAKQAEEELEKVGDKLKQVFGSGIDANGLSAALEPITADLKTISEFIDNLAKNNSIDGLTQSFNNLSKTLDKLLTNFKTTKDILDTGFSNNITESLSNGNTVKAAQQTGKKIGDTIEESVKQSINLDDVIDKEVLSLMKEYGVKGKKGSASFNDIRQSLVNYRDELKLSNSFGVDDEFASFGVANIRKVTSAIANHKKEINQTALSYKELKEYVTSANKNAKIHLPDTIRQEYGDDFSSMRKSLGKAFTTGSGVDFETWIEQLNYDLGHTIDLSQGAEAAFGDLYNKLNLAKGSKYISGDDLFKQGDLNVEDISNNIVSALDAIDKAEMEIAQSSIESANIVTQNEEKKRQEYEKTLAEKRQELEAINKTIKDFDELIAEQTQSGIGSEELQSYQTTLSAFKEEQTELLADIKQIETSLYAIGASDSGIENVENDFKEMAAAAGNAEDVIDGIRNELGTLNINFKGADTVTKDLQDMNLEIQKVTARINGNDIEVSIRGIEKTADGFDKVVTATKRYEDAIDNTSNVNKTISQTFETSSDAAKKAQKETEDSFKRLKSLAQEMSKLEIAKLDASKSVDEINSLERVLNGLESEYRELYSTIEKNLSADQFKELDKIFANTTGEVREFKNELAKSTEAKELAYGLEKLKSLTKEIAGLKIDVFNFEDADNIQRASNRLNELEKEATELRAELQRKFPTASFDQIDDVARKGEEALSKLINKAAEAKAELARNIKLDIELGNFDDDISKMYDKFNKLSEAPKKLEESIRQVENALHEMELAAGTGDEVADTEKLVNAQKEYAAALEKTNNLLRIQAREENAAAKMQKLQDDRELFQSKIDSWLTQNSAATKKFGASMLELKAKAESCDRVTLNHLEKEFKKLDNAAEKSGLKIQNLADRIRTKFKEYSAYLSVAEVFMYITQGLKDMFDQVVAIDTAMTELKKVTDETDASYNQFLSNAASRAKEIGTTIDGLVTSTADFARLGYGFKDSQGLAEIANIYSVVGDEIDGVEDATKSLISTLAAFKDEASGISDSDFAMDIVDKFNEVSNNFAISSGGIGEAMQRSASSLRAANNTIDESIALITAANTVVQDPTSVGTAFKTISMRIRGAKTELEEAGLETEGMVESTAKLRGEILALTGVDIMDGANQFKSTYAIMDELAAKWENLTDIQQATVTELIAGKRQGNVVSSLMQNFDLARDALETSLNSSGSAMKEHEKWQQSLEARLLKLKATWQSLSQSFMSSDFLKVALDSVIALVDGIDKLISSVGTLPTLLGIFTAISGFNKISLVSKSVGGLTSLADILPTLSLAFPNAAKGISIFTTALSSGVGIIGVVKAALSGLWTVIAAHPIIATVAAVGLAIVAFNKWYESSEELADRIGEVTAKYKEQRDSLAKLKGSYDTSNEDALISKYEKLSKGVNALGENVSLTSDEYSEYQGIVSTIAEQIPSLVAGYNSQGDAILSCAGDVDKLTEAYKNLIREQNKKVLDNGEDIFKDFKNDIEKSSAYDSTNKKYDIGHIKELQELLNSDDLEADIAKLSGNEAIRISKLLEKYGVDRDYLFSGEKGYETWQEHIARAISEDKAEIKGILDQAADDINAYAEDLGVVTEAYFSKAFLDDYSDMSDRMQNVIKQITSGFDSDFYAQFLDDENPYESLTNYLESILNAFDNLNSADTETFEAAFDLKTKFNGGDITYGEYVNGLKNAEELIGKLGLDDEVENQIKLALNTEEVTKDYETLKNRLTSEDYNIQMKPEVAEEFLNGLNSSELAVAVDLIANEEIDFSKFNEDSFKKYIEEQAKIQEALDFEADFEIDTTALEKLNEILAESASACGLSEDSIDSLKTKYAKLDSFNPAKLFEATANGVKVNRDELVKLEKEYNNLTKTEVKKHLETLVNEYNNVTKEIDKCSNAAERAELIAKREGYADKIEELATYEAQLEGVTGAYQRWLKAQETPEDYEGYQAVATGREDVKDEIKRGFISNATKEYIDLLSGEDLVGGTIDDYAEAWEKLDKKVGSTSYSIHDFFTVNDDGDITSTGIDRFFDGIQKDFKGEVYKFNKDTGEWYYDFSSENLQKIQDEWGIGIEAIELLLEAAASAGYNVDWDGILDNIDLDTSNFETLVSTAEKAQEAFNKLKGVDDVDFNFSATGVEEAATEVEKARDVYLDLITNKDGTINLEAKGASQMRVMLSALLIQKQQLEDSNIVLNIDTSKLDKSQKDVADAINAVKNFREKYKNLEIAVTTGQGIKEAKDELSGAMDDLQKLGGEGVDIAAQLILGEGADGSTLQSKVDTAIKLVEADDIKVGCKLDETAIGDLNSQILTNFTPEATVKITKIDESLVGEYTSTEKTAEGTVKWSNDDSLVIQFQNADHKAEGIVDWANNTKNVKKSFSADGTVKWTSGNNVKVKVISSANGTANVDGTTGRAFKQGSWGIKGSGTALVGELGMETLVRDGRFYTIGDNGAEFINYKPNDIIFNHKQTEELFKYGKVLSDSGRGKVFANGSAFAWGATSTSSSFAKNRLSKRDKVDLIEKDKNKSKTKSKTEVKGNSVTTNVTTTFGATATESDFSKNKNVGNSSSSSSSSSKDKTEESFDWIEVAINRIERAIDNLDRKASNVYASWSSRNKALSDEISKVGDEIALQEKARRGYLAEAKSVGLSSSWVSKVQSGAIDIDTITDENLAKKIKDYQAWYEKALDCEDAIEELKIKESDLHKQRFDNIITRYEGILDDIEHEKDLIEEYISQHENRNLSDFVAHDIKDYEVIAEYYQDLITQEQKNLIQLQKEKAELMAEFNSGNIKEGTEAWNEMQAKIHDVDLAIQQANTSIIELGNDIAESYKNAFDDIVSQFDHRLSVIEFKKNMIEEGISHSEAQGWLVSGEYYEALIDMEQDNVDKLQEKKSSLLSQLEKGVTADGKSIEMYSEAWWEMCEEIDATTLAIEQSNNALLEYEQTLQQLSWETFDLLQEKISAVTEEADFLIDLLSNKKLYDDNGKLTDEGTATLGLHGQNFNTYMYQADLAAEEAEKLKKELEDDPFDTELESRYREMVALQQEHILAAEAEKDAIKDMVEEGINLELEALQEKIDLYNEALDSQKDLYDYQKKVKEQTEEIASLEKQMAAYAGDNSEEAQAKIQELKVSLEDAKADLEETEYDKYISDQKQMLDALYLEYETILNERLDNIDALVINVIEQINANAIGINTTLQETATSVGYTLSTEMQNIWGLAAAQMQNDAAERVRETTRIVDELVANGKMSHEDADKIIAALGTGEESGVRNATNIINQLVEEGRLSANDANLLRTTVTTTGNEYKGVVTTYGNNFTNAQTTTNSALRTINTNLQNMISQLNSIAKTKVSSAKISSSTTSKQATAGSNGNKNNSSNKNNNSNSNGNNSNKNNQTTTSSGDGVAKIGDKVKFVSGKYYYDPTGKDPLGSKNLGKEVYITNINKNSWATHPIHISTGNKLGKGDLGWLKKSQISGYAIGKEKFFDDEIAWTQEGNKQEFIVRPSDGAILTPIARGDSVLNAVASKNIWDMANNPAEFIRDNLSFGSNSIPNNSNVQSNYTQNLDKVVFNLPNVKNYEELLSAMQKDKNFERLISSMTIDRLAGKSSLAKGKAIR